jgi:hypothetical protein
MTLFIAHIAGPKLVCKVPDTWGFALIEDVVGYLSSEKNN